MVRWSIIFGVAAAMLCAGPGWAADNPPKLPPEIARLPKLSVKLTVSQERDVWPDSPGYDFHEKLTWIGGGRGGGMADTLRNVTGGKGVFTATAAGAVPNGPCGKTRYRLKAQGAVIESTSFSLDLTFKQNSGLSGKGLEGWSLTTPAALWKGTLEVTKREDCGGKSSEDSGDWFDSHWWRGGTAPSGGTPMRAPSIRVAKSGVVTITGSAQARFGAVKQTVSFTVTCSNPTCLAIPRYRYVDVDTDGAIAGSKG